MKSMFPKIMIAGLAGSLVAQRAPAPADPLSHARTSFDLVVHAPYSVAAPLFGPEGERAWAGESWNPQFIYPQSAADVEGAVFTVRHGNHSATWVTSVRDVEGRHFQYVYFMPDIMVTVIDVRLTPMGADSTGVNVTYTRTALTSEGNPHVAAMSDGDKRAGKEWQQAIDKYLAAQKAGVIQ